MMSRRSPLSYAESAKQQSCRRGAELTPWLFRSASADEARAVNEIYRASWPTSVRHVASEPVIDALLRERSERLGLESIEESGSGFELAMEGARPVAFCGWISQLSGPASSSGYL